MACKLTRLSDGTFQGPTGATVQVDIRSPQPAQTSHIFYAGESDGATPFEFKIRSGPNKLLVAVVGVQNDQKMAVVEVSGGADCHLKNFRWTSTHFFTVLDIEGV